MEHTLLAPWEDIETVPVEYLYERIRNRRNALLQACDWTQLPDAPVDREAWAAYRQALRDAPQNWTPGPEWVPPTPPAN